MSKQMKFTKKDVINLLWQFNQLEAEIIDDTLVQEIAVANPSPENTMLFFEFEGVKFFALFDEDTTKRHFTHEIRKVNSNVDVVVIGAEDFKGKTVSLAKEKIAKKRLDVVLTERNFKLRRNLKLREDIPRGILQKYIKNGQVMVDGEVVIRPSQLVKVDAEIAIEEREKKETEKLDLPVIFENEDVVVIDKPVGILAHSKGEFNDEFTVADFVKLKVDLADEDAESFGTNRAGIAHRLDRGTSGVMIMAKNENALKKLQKQFAERKTKKVYFAIVQGQMKQSQALINLPIARNLKKPTTFRVDPSGREAETMFEVMKTNGEYSLLKLTPKTGRTHQLRVHLAYVGHPIVGDEIYGGKKAERTMLHAGSLEITLPDSSRRIFEAAMPKEFRKYVD